MGYRKNLPRKWWWMIVKNPRVLWPLNFERKTLVREKPRVFNSEHFNGKSAKNPKPQKPWRLGFYTKVTNTTILEVDKNWRMMKMHRQKIEKRKWRRTRIPKRESQGWQKNRGDVRLSKTQKPPSKTLRVRFIGKGCIWRSLLEMN